MAAPSAPTLARGAVRSNEQKRQAERKAEDPREPRRAEERQDSPGRGAYGRVRRAWCLSRKAVNCDDLHTSSHCRLTVQTRTNVVCL